MTTVINLFAGPGTGKSTTAAGLFYEMKLRGYDVELVREYAKTFAYGQTLPSQPYLFAKQLKAESQLYNQVDWIITDSPLYLSAIYGEEHLMLPLVKTVAKDRKEINFFLTRQKPYHQNGRFQTEAGAKEIDVLIKKFLDFYKIPHTVLEVKDRDRVAAILDEINDNLPDVRNAPK